MSSGDDAAELRDFVDDLVNEAVNAVLLQLDAPVRFEVDRWERTAPHKVLAPEAGPNEEFVARAVRADVVLCILFDRLGQGTQEELDAAVACETSELSIIWCGDPSAEVAPELRDWMARHTNLVLWGRAGLSGRVGLPGTVGPMIAIFRFFLEATLQSIAQLDHSKEPLRERR